MKRYTIGVALILLLLAPELARAASAVPAIPEGAPRRGLPAVGARTARKAPYRDAVAAESDTLRLVALMIEFPADGTAATSGDGTFGSARDANELVFGEGLDPNPYAVPHDAPYFREQLAYLAQYYRAVSYGALEIVPTVVESVLVAPEPMEYYGDNDSVGTRQVRLFDDAVRRSDPYVDFAAYDVVVVIHAGVGEETDVLGNSPGDLWTTYYTPGDLAGALADSGTAPRDYRGIETDDSLPGGAPFYVSKGVLLPETETQDDFAQWLLGVAAHMTGRVLGAPSLFDPTPADSPNSLGIGNFGIMGTGLWNSGGILPPHPCVWTKIHLGWVDPLVITRDTTIALPLVERADSGVKAIKIPITESEYYLLENRFPDENGDALFNFADVNGDNRLDIFEDSYDGAEFDWSLPDEGSLDGSGILIWHIDEAKIAESGDFLEVNRVNADPGRKGVDLEEADGIQDLDMRPTSLDNFGNRYDAWSTVNPYLREGARFGRESEPATRTNFGAATGITVEVTSDPGSLMTVSIDFTEGTPGWPVEGREGWKLVGPALPVHIPGGRGVYFACAFHDTVSGTGYGDLLSTAGESLDGWPVDLGAVPSFAPIYAAVPQDASFFRLVFPLTDGSIAWYEGFGTLSGRFDGRPGGETVYLSSGQLPSGIFPLSVAGDTTVVERITFDGRGEILRVPGRAVGPAVISENIVFATEEGEVWSVRYEGSVNWRYDVGETPWPPLSARLPGGGRAVIVLAGTKLHLIDDESGLPLPGSPLVLPAAASGGAAVGDFDADGSPEIVFGTEDGYLRAVNVTLASSVGWPLLRESGIDEEPFDVVAGAPAIGDWDDDGEMEIALITRHGVLDLLGPHGVSEEGFPVSFAGEAPYGISLGKTAAGDSTFLFASTARGRLELALRGVASNPTIEWGGFRNGNPLAGYYVPQVDGSPPGGGLIVEAETFAYPNPSREGHTVIHYRVSRRAAVTIAVYDVAGSLLDEFGPFDRPPESSELRWETSGRASGVYFVRVEAEADGEKAHRFLPVAIQR